MIKRAALLLLCVGIFSCASLQQKRYDGSVEEVIAWINAGRTAELAALTKTPFLLDREIIILAQDIEEFWSRAVEAGFRIPAPRFIESFPVAPDTYKTFGSTMEVKSFFQKYVTERAYVVNVETESTILRFLMDRVKLGEIRILGMAGPEPL